MNIICLEEPGAFISRCGGFLCKSEAANNLMIGSARQAEMCPDRTGAFFGAALEAGQEVIGRWGTRFTWFSSGCRCDRSFGDYRNPTQVQIPSAL